MSIFYFQLFFEIYVFLFTLYPGYSPPPLHLSSSLPPHLPTSQKRLALFHILPCRSAHQIESGLIMTAKAVLPG